MPNKQLNENTKFYKFYKIMVIDIKRKGIYSAPTEARWKLSKEVFTLSANIL